METVSLEGVTIRLAHPDDFTADWVGGDTLMQQLLAAWMVLEPRDLPMNPRLIGRPGVGKTTLAYAAARRLGRPVYIFQATMDTRPEDLLIAPVVGPKQQILYVASPLVTAMLRGGVCILDEGNRMSEKSWAGLAPLLDNRRYVESIVAGVKIKAHPDFRFVATMNQDTSTFDLPEYIQSRLQPQIEVPFPSRDEERAVLAYNLPFGPAEMVDYVADFLARAHACDEPFTVRDGINILRYALKLGGPSAPADGTQIPQPKSSNTDIRRRAKSRVKSPLFLTGKEFSARANWASLVEQAVRQVAGGSAARYLTDNTVPKRRKTRPSDDFETEDVEADEAATPAGDRPSTLSLEESKPLLRDNGHVPKERRETTQS